MTDGDNGSAISGDAGAGIDQAGDANSRPKWFDEFSQTLDKRFEGLAIKLREKDAAKPANGDATNTPRAATSIDVEAAYELGVVAALLPDAAREHLQAMASQGASFADRLAAARLIKQFGAPANGAHNQSATTPTGKAASAAPRDTPTVPKSQAEWIALRRQASTDPHARIRYDNLIADDAFDPARLPER